MRKTTYTLIMAVLVLLAACTKDGDTIFEPDPTDQVSTSPLVTVLYEPDGIGDQSYNDLVYQGVEEAAMLMGLRTPHHTPEDYIDFRRVISAMELMRRQANYSVAAVAQDAGFSSIRTLQRRMQQAIGMTPVEFRLLIEPPKPEGG